MALIKINNNTLSAITGLPSAIDTGSLVKTVSSSSTSSASNVTLTNCFTSDYNSYLVFVSLVNASSGQNTLMRYITSSTGELTSNYRWSLAMFHSDNSTSFIESNSDSSIQTVRTGSGTPSQGIMLHFQGVNNSSSAKMCSGQFQHHHSSYNSTCIIGGFNTNTETLTGLKFFSSSGDIASHDITCYGVKV